MEGWIDGQIDGCSEGKSGEWMNGLLEYWRTNAHVE